MKNNFEESDRDQMIKRLDRQYREVSCWRDELRISGEGRATDLETVGSNTMLILANCEP